MEANVTQDGKLGSAEDLHPLEIPRIPSDPVSLPIAHYRWTKTTGPKAWGNLAWDQEAIHVKLCAYERPLAVRVMEDGGNVWEDSCLELFIRPDQNPEYLNIEINPLGAMIFGLGPGREARQDLLELKPRLEPILTLEPCAGRWAVSFKLPLAMLREIYKGPVGPLFRANLFKGGGVDDHYGMWREVQAAEPDFHRPEYFGALILQDPASG
jgi:hypothetical protein